MDSYATNTDQRQEDARKSIPAYVDQLIGSLPDVTAREVEVLYREYRAYWRSKNPFRHRYRLVCSDMADGEDMLSLLAQLHDPGNLERRDAFHKLACLKMLVEQRAEARRGLPIIGAR